MSRLCPFMLLFERAPRLQVANFQQSCSRRILKYDDQTSGTQTLPADEVLLMSL